MSVSRKSTPELKLFTPFPSHWQSKKKSARASAPVAAMGLRRKRTGLHTIKLKPPLANMKVNWRNVDKAIADWLLFEAIR